MAAKRSGEFFTSARPPRASLSEGRSFERSWGLCRLTRRIVIAARRSRTPIAPKVHRGSMPYTAPTRSGATTAATCHIAESAGMRRGRLLRDTTLAGRARLAGLANPRAVP